MTYKERIERVARAIYEDWRKTRKPPEPMPPWEIASDADHEDCKQMARAADRAVLEAIREPTEKMKCTGGEVAILRGVMAISLDQDEVTSIYQAVHAAIPRGEG